LYSAFAVVILTCSCDMATSWPCMRVTCEPGLLRW